MRALVHDAVIQVTPQMRVLVATEPADFRKGIDGLSRLAQERLSADPFSGTVFVFRNRRGTAVKILVYNGRGFWLCQLRLSQGRFPFWPRGGPGSGEARTLEAHQLQVLLSGGNFEAADGVPIWRPVG